MGVSLGCIDPPVGVLEELSERVPEPSSTAIVVECGAQIVGQVVALGDFGFELDRDHVAGTDGTDDRPPKRIPKPWVSSSMTARTPMALTVPLTS